MATPYQLSQYAMWYQCIGQYDIPRFRAGGVTAQVMAIFLRDELLDMALQHALDMVSAFHREIEDNPDTVMLATTVDDIRLAKTQKKTALMLSFEGAEPIGRDLNLLEIFYKLGLRMVSLTHSRRNLMADGTQMNTTVGGLTDLGREAVRRMNELGIVIDMAHLSDTSIWEVLELSTAPVIISHTNIRSGTPGYRLGVTELEPKRNMSKLKAIADKGGMVGVIFWNQSDAETIADEIDAVIQHVGDDYVGLGTDFYSLEYVPKGLEDISRLPALTDVLVARGYSDSTILKILGENYLRVFEAVLKAE
jgi:membrane dipeptidase